MLMGIILSDITDIFKNIKKINLYVPTSYLLSIKNLKLNLVRSV